MTDEAKEARAAYMKQYREENKERINEYKRDWQKKNPEKVKAYAAAYWERKAADKAL